MADALPTFIIIGAMKCGTTSMHHNLDLHPDISMSPTKELDFFVDRSTKNWHRSLDWYRSHFRSEAGARGESSPNYTKRLLFPRVPERMHAVLPHAKLIYILRDPIDRIVSHYVHRVSARYEHQTLEGALGALEGNHYVDCSSYHHQLESYLKLYPLERIFVTSLEEMREDIARVMSEVFRFLEVDDRLFSEQFAIARHRSQEKVRPNAIGAWILRRMRRSAQRRWRRRRAYRALFFRTVEQPTIAPELRARLVSRLEADVSQLRALKALVALVAAGRGAGSKLPGCSDAVQRPSPFRRQVGAHDFTFEARSGFTHVAARRPADPALMGLCPESFRRVGHPPRPLVATARARHLFISRRSAKSRLNRVWT